MSILGGLFGNPNDGYSFGVFGDARAVPAEQLIAAQMHMLAQAKPGPEWYLQLQNYRPPVHVPAGWADWVAIGDELH